MKKFLLLSILVLSSGCTQYYQNYPAQYQSCQKVVPACIYDMNNMCRLDFVCIK